MANRALFEGLNDIDAATARRRFRAREARPGEVLVTEGEVGRTLCYVVSGTLEIRAGDAVVGEAGPGAVLGETALFEDIERTATVVARTGVVLWELDRDGFEELRDTVHPLCRNLERAAIADQVARIHAVGERVAALELGPVLELPTGFFAAVRRLFGGGGTRSVAGDARAALTASGLFRDAPPAVLDAVAPQFGALRCQGGAMLCTEGQVGTRMFVLEEGLVDVVVAADGEPRVIATLEPGAAFGMVSLASGRPRMSSCVVRDGACVHVLEAGAWRALAEEPYVVGSAFRRAMIRALAEQLRFTNAQLAAWAADPNAAALDGAKRGLG